VTATGELGIISACSIKCGEFADCLRDQSPKQEGFCSMAFVSSYCTRDVPWKAVNRQTGNYEYYTLSKYTVCGSCEFVNC
jgi:hypothetical protein